MSKILIVDDDPNIIFLIKTTLSKEPKYLIDSAESGEAALEKIEADMPDIVLLDVMMPGISGFDVCRKIKQNDKTKFIPVIIITSRRGMEDKLRGMKIGANDYITKPFNPEELRARVQAQLRIKDLESELASSRELETALKMSITLQHEINNPLSGVIGGATLLQDWENLSKDEINRITIDMLSLALRIKEIVHRLSKITKVKSVQYVRGAEMIDIDESSASPDDE